MFYFQDKERYINEKLGNKKNVKKSFGAIEIIKNKRSISFLLFKKRHSYEYSEFLSGKKEMIDFLCQKEKSFLGEVDLSENNEIFVPYHFSKGRKEPKESQIDCAKREYFEETGIEILAEPIIPTCFSEFFIGSNKIFYETHYYIFEFRSIENFKKVEFDSFKFLEIPKFTLKCKFFEWISKFNTRENEIFERTFDIICRIYMKIMY